MVSAMWQEGNKVADGIKVANYLTLIRKLPHIIWVGPMKSQESLKCGRGRQERGSQRDGSVRKT